MMLLKLLHNLSLQQLQCCFSFLHSAISTHPEIETNTKSELEESSFESNEEYEQPPKCRLQNEAQNNEWNWVQVEADTIIDQIHFKFAEEEGVAVRLEPGDKKDIDFFNLYFTDRIIEHLVVKTNRYVEQFIDSQKNEDGSLDTSYLALWTPVDSVEMKKFLGLTFLMGIVKLPSVMLYWSRDELCHNSIFSRSMTQNRYLIIMKFLHFSDSSGYDPNDENRDDLAKCNHYLS